MVLAAHGAGTSIELTASIELALTADEAGCQAAAQADRANNSSLVNDLVAAPRRKAQAVPT